MQFLTLDFGFKETERIFATDGTDTIESKKR